MEWRRRRPCHLIPQCDIFYHNGMSLILKRTTTRSSTLLRHALRITLILWWEEDHPIEKRPMESFGSGLIGCCCEVETRIMPLRFFVDTHRHRRYNCCKIRCHDCCKNKMPAIKTDLTPCATSSYRLSTFSNIPLYYRLCNHHHPFPTPLSVVVSRQPLSKLNPSTKGRSC